MNGTIFFESVEELARFLTVFEGEELFSIIPVDNGYSLTFYVEE